MFRQPQAFYYPVHGYGPYPAYPQYRAPGYPPYASFYPFAEQIRFEMKDSGMEPLVINIEKVAKHNNTFRTAIWTGKYFQVTVMSIPVGEDIGLEVHPETDQFIRIEEGTGLVQMGDSKDRLDFQADAGEDFAVMIPAGKWHNVTNTGNIPLKVYVIYAPPEHPRGTVHATKADAMAAHD